MMLKQTKIVASISDQRCEVEFIRDLFKAGMNVVRMNTAHASREGFEKLITNVREVSNRIAILMDTKGPEVRTTAIAGGEPIPYQIGDKVKIVGNPAQETTRECIAVSYPGFVHDLQVDGDILIDDGDLELRVIEKTDEYLLCEVQNEATLGNRKSVNVPGVRINLPSLTEKDRNNILYAIEKDIDFIAHSFVRNKQDVLDIRQILDAYGSDIKIIAKIENQPGIDNIEDIFTECTGIMIARGDMGVEVPYEELPSIQKELIGKCRLLGKRVITATEMLESMTHNIRPTRAEIADVANAVYDGTSAIMLSGETAAGEHPVEALSAMARIAEYTEAHINYAKRFPKTQFEIHDTLDAISHATCGMAIDIGAKVITVCSITGRTARLISRFRGPTDIIGLTTNERAYRKLALSWGITPVMSEVYESTDVLFYHALQVSRKVMQLEKGDKVIITGGIINGRSGNTNTIKVEYA